MFDFTFLLAQQMPIIEGRNMVISLLAIVLFLGVGLWIFIKYLSSDDEIICPNCGSLLPSIMDFQVEVSGNDVQYRCKKCPTGFAKPAKPPANA